MREAFRDFSLNIGGRLVHFAKPAAMGVINATPDSFYAESRCVTPDSAATKARQMAADGAEIIDIGACSTRPGSVAPGTAEELSRLLPVIETVKLALSNSGVLISVDTFRAEVAEAAIDAGAQIVNDVSFLGDPEMLPLLTARRVPYILTHNVALPEEMPTKEVTPFVIRQLQEKLAELRLAGVADVIVDPGFGFGKTLEQNYALMADLELFGELNAPLLVGISRKSLITNALGIQPDDALAPTQALSLTALQRGAAILRAHDVAATVSTIKINELLRQHSF